MPVGSCFTPPQSKSLLSRIVAPRSVDRNSTPVRGSRMTSFPRWHLTPNNCMAAALWMAVAFRHWPMFTALQRQTIFQIL